MIKKRHFLIVIGVLLAGFIVGSFLDLQINQAIFSKDNTFGLIMASFAVYPCYAGLAFISGGLFATGLKRKDLHIALKILTFFLSALAYAMAVYLCGGEWPSSNGFNDEKLAPFSYGLAALIFAGVFFLAYKVCAKGDLPKLWMALMVMAVIFVIALLPTGFVVKLILHRPRYRVCVREGITDFYNWWQTCKEYKEIIARKITVDGFLIDKEEFKSFPSGHTGTAAIMMMFLPYSSIFFKRMKGKEVVMFYTGFVWMLLMMYSRMRVGAHYLTDTCMGGLVIMVVYFVIHVFATSKGWIFKEEYHPEEPKEAVAA